MKKILLILWLIIVIGCASKKAGLTASQQGDTRTSSVQNIDDKTFLLLQITDDKTYGFEKSNPVKVGRIKESSGPLKESS